MGVSNVEPIAIIGGGPAGLIAAEVLSRAGHRVVLFDRMGMIGRKFLLAGRGGLNLTHSELLPDFLGRYGDCPEVQRAVREFPPSALVEWCEGLGHPTFVGSSGRVFPIEKRAAPLLRSWIERLRDLGVEFELHTRWIGWEADGSLRFIDKSGVERSFQAAATVLALGGASWPGTGSDGMWTDYLVQRGVSVRPLAPANSGFVIEWDEWTAERVAGQPLKNISLSLGPTTVRGEAMLTSTGIEGGVVYALGSAIREEIAKYGSATVGVDLRADLPLARIKERLNKPRGTASTASFLRKAIGLTPVESAILRTARSPLPNRTDALAYLVKSCPLRLIRSQPIERAISSSGGILFEEINEDWMLRKVPGVFVAGEMLDWEAPTGGYLLQASFATGIAAAKGLLRFVNGDRGAQG